MKNDFLNLSKRLVAIASTSNSLDGLEKTMQIALKELQQFTVEYFEKNDVRSVLVYNTPKRPKKFKILFNAHLDVVPGKSYKPSIKGDRLYGVGALDMKSNAACMITVFKQVANKINYPLAVQLTTDEELGGLNGTKYQIEKGVRADFVIAGETTNFDIVNKAKGVLWLKISCKGKSAHGAYTWRGDNAVWKMNEFLAVLKKNFPLPKKEVWATTVNVSSVQTDSTAFNKVPDYCKILLDVRFVPEDEKTILEKFKKLLSKEFSMEILMHEPAKNVDQNNKYVKRLQETINSNLRRKIDLRGAHGTSDARHFAKKGIPAVEFGAFGGNIGSDNEWISISSLEKYTKILTEFLFSVE